MRDGAPELARLPVGVGPRQERERAIRRADEVPRVVGHTADGVAASTKAGVGMIISSGLQGKVTVG